MAITSGLGVGVFLAIYFQSLSLCSFYVFFANKSTWDSNRSWCIPGCPSSLICPIGVEAGVGISLATHLFLIHLPGDSSKSWCVLGCPSFLLSLIGVVTGVGAPLATHLFF